MAHFRNRRKGITEGPVSASLFFESPKIHSGLGTPKVNFALQARRRSLIVLGFSDILYAQVLRLYVIPHYVNIPVPLGDYLVTSYYSKACVLFAPPLAITTTPRKHLQIWFCSKRSLRSQYTPLVEFSHRPFNRSQGGFRVDPRPCRCS